MSAAPFGGGGLSASRACFSFVMCTSAASLDIPFYSSMHEAGFCATPTRLRELRLEAVALQAAAGRLQRAWARSVQTRVHTVLAQMRRACVSIQRMARGALVRWPLAASSWEGHDEAGPLPPHWDWSYDRTTGERVFYHIHSRRAVAGCGVCMRRPQRPLLPTSLASHIAAAPARDARPPGEHPHHLPTSSHADY